eukprot:TRINITY_DN48354_c0_g1_i3.p1 TRINITY_DN48354_c0_g1~~TRINITY_DN48354_c0_g1_i3.p1  ORF type:complete len:512 (-),score=73.59 TRINITY_DN48354_c0_g1_i3:763-2298(-)
MSSIKFHTLLILVFFLAHNAYQLPILKPNRENIPFKTILSIDGGGVRAAIPLAILIELENKIKTSMVENAELLISNGVFQESDLEVLQKGTDAFSIQLADFFDLAAGVSAGSIVSAYIATRGENVQGEYSSPPGTAAAGLELFSEQAGKIFKSTFFRQGLTVAEYSADGIDSSLQEIFGQNTLLSNIKNITYFVTSYELENSRAIFFFADGVFGDDGIVVSDRPITVANEVPDIEQLNLEIMNQSDFRVWETVRCSAAAPTLLPSHVIESTNGDYKGTCIDGAVIANNPDMYALTYLSSRQSVNIADIAVLSLGQGVLIYDMAEGRSLDRGAQPVAAPEPVAAAVTEPPIVAVAPDDDDVWGSPNAISPANSRLGQKKKKKKLYQINHLVLRSSDFKSTNNSIKFLACNNLIQLLYFTLLCCDQTQNSRANILYCSKMYIQSKFLQIQVVIGICLRQAYPYLINFDCILFLKEVEFFRCRFQICVDLNLHITIKENKKILGDGNLPQYQES